MRKTNWKKLAWKAFSRYIRLRDCLESTGDPNWGICCTCKQKTEFNGLQAGHFIGGRGNSILLHEECVHAQCMRCNIWLKGNLVEYYIFMLNRYGQEKINELRILAKQPKPMAKYEWEALYHYFKEKADGLMTL